MATEKRLIDARYLTSQMYLICEACQTENIFIDAIIDEIDNAPDVDAVEVDEIKLHHILIDNEGVPEVKLQIGDRYFILRTDPVDVREVVHGEWSTIEDDYTGMVALQCSECNQEWWFEDEPPMKIYHYCPNCGARMMDGDGNG